MTGNLKKSNGTRTREARRNKWQYLYENPRHPPDVPKKSTVAAFHLITGDDYLAKHLHRIGISTTLTCKLFYSQGKFYLSHYDIFPAIVMENCRAPITRESKFNDLNPNQYTFEKPQA